MWKFERILTKPGIGSNVILSLNYTYLAQLHKELVSGLIDGRIIEPDRITIRAAS
jgi:hypothetical protein